VRAVILAAGYATRLHPYTRLYPKTLLRVGGRPLLDATVEALAGSPGLEDLTLVTNSRFAAFFALWSRRSPAAGLCPVTVLDDGTTTNETRRGSVGDLLFAMDRLGLDDDLLVVCSDKLFSFSIPAFLAFAREKGGGANTCEDAGDPAKLAGRRGCLVLAPDGRIAEFVEKPARPPSSIESIAFYVFPRDTLPLVREYAHATGRPDAPGFLMEWLVPRAPFYGWPIDGDCLDVGDPASYREADRFAWERRNEKVKKAAAVEVLLHGGGLDEGALAGMLDRLEAEPGVTMVHLAVAPADLQRAEAWVAAHPHLVPVDAVEASLPPAELARSRRCSRVIPLQASAAEVGRLLRQDAP
jgi:glucose-1-phosphate thymidylyltransferase